MLRRIVAQPMEQMLGLVSLCSGGVLARHPKLRVAFLEANCTWLPGCFGVSTKAGSVKEMSGPTI